MHVGFRKSYRKLFHQYLIGQQQFIRHMAEHMHVFCAYIDVIRSDPEIRGRKTYECIPQLGLVQTCMGPKQIGLFRAGPKPQCRASIAQGYKTVGDFGDAAQIESVKVLSLSKLLIEQRIPIKHFQHLLHLI